MRPASSEPVMIVDESSNLAIMTTRYLLIDASVPYGLGVNVIQSR
jgi:hypothetical protein